MSGGLDIADLGELYDRHGFALHRRCRRLLRNESEAHDALQEVFVRAIRHRSSYAGGDLHTWLCRIADRVCWDMLSRRRTRPSGAEVDLEAPAFETLDAETRTTVGSALMRCDSDARQAAVLHYVHELTQEEVARDLGVSRKRVRTLLATFLEGARGLFRVAPIEEEPK